MSTPQKSYGEVFWQEPPRAGGRTYDFTGQISRTQTVPEDDKTELLDIVTDLGAQTGAYTFPRPRLSDLHAEEVSIEGPLTRLNMNNDKWGGAFLQSPKAIYTDSFKRRTPGDKTGNEITAFAADTYANSPRDGEIGPVEHLRRRRRAERRIMAIGSTASQPAVEANNGAILGFNDGYIDAQEALLNESGLTDSDLSRLLDGLKTLDDNKETLAPEQPDSSQESSPLFDELLAQTNLADLFN